eukprot:657934-Prorocentrum_minimum.AAC.1
MRPATVKSYWALPCFICVNCRVKCDAVLTANRRRRLYLIKDLRIQSRVDIDRQIDSRTGCRLVVDDNSRPLTRSRRQLAA